MNGIVMSFADGTTFFVGLALVLVAEVLLACFQKRFVLSAVTILTIVGIILVVISSTPLPTWAYLCWLTPALAGLVLFNRSASSQKLRLAVCAGLLISTVGLFLAEIPHHRLPQLTVSGDTTVYVIGDSISAGIGMEHRCWPTVLDEMTTLRVVNLAQAGATVKSAMAQAKGITESNSLVIVEIGGNDLLGQTDASTFRSQFETLIASLCSEQHQVLVVELPLYPFQNSYGHAQRSVVARYEVAMLGKRYFAKVFAAENGTLDGLHLSQAGHDAMAKIIAQVVKRK